MSKSLESRGEDWEFSVSFLIMFSSPGTFILVLVGFPSLMSNLSDKLSIPVMIGGLTLWFIMLFWAINQQEKYL